MPGAGTVKQGATRGPGGQACRRRVLIVDDNEANVLLLQAYLAQTYDIDVARDADSALEKVRDRAPDLVLLDVMLPDVDGHQICEVLKNDGIMRFIPIVGPTRPDGRHDRLLGLDTGVDSLPAPSCDWLAMHLRADNLVRCNDLKEEKVESDRHLETETEREQWGITRDVIYALSGGKLVLADEAALDHARSGARPRGRLEIATPADVGGARALTERILRDMHVEGDRIFDLALCVSEAGTNALTHAHGGVLEVFEMDGRVQAWVTDQGSGIDLSLLPSSTLMKGWSSTTSLGCGFTILIELLDLVVLSTSGHGTVVIMEMALEPQAKADDCVLKPFAGCDPSSWVKNLMAAS